MFFHRCSYVNPEGLKGNPVPSSHTVYPAAAAAVAALEL
jgi:hypothetical protein